MLLAIIVSKLPLFCIIRHEKSRSIYTNYNHIPPALVKAKGVLPVGKEAPEGGLKKNGWYAPNAKKVQLRHAFSVPID